MKKIKIYTLILFISAICISSCNEDVVLKEIPKDFLTPENSFTNNEQFESALADVYKSVRNYTLTNFPGGRYNGHFFLQGVELDLFSKYSGGTTNSPKINWSVWNADNYFVRTLWQWYYRVIFKTNVIIGRAEEEQAEWDSEEQKNALVAEARFLRAFSYTFLANMWGGVPLVLEETSEAKFDYTRATQTEVYNQCVEDLLFATTHMKTVDEIKGGRAPRAAAYHLLAQVYIQMGKYQEAINAATQVIDDPNYHLMTERFGKLKDFKFQGWDYQGPHDEPWGDVYWDLFRNGNFNRIDGNMECIWNAQFEYGVEGGGGTNFIMDYAMGGPHISHMKDIDNVRNVLFQDTLGGLQVGWSIPTDYLRYQIWEFKNDWDNDIRNSKYNIHRDWYYTNPNSQFYGQLVTEQNIYSPGAYQSLTSPMLCKMTQALQEGGDFRWEDEGIVNYIDNGRHWKDWYYMRLAETYLLRAEAYYLDGDNANAAVDINALRNRAHATPVNAGEVDLDLILDERARELYGEEIRVNTLLRMGKFAEYLMRYNEDVVDNGYQLDDHFNKFPIPNSEIEANKETVLEQNPGY